LIKKLTKIKIIYDNEGEISLFDVFAKNKVRLPLVVMEMISNKIVGNENVKYDWFVPNNEIEFHRIKIKVEKLAQGYSAYIDYEETLVLGVGLTIKEAVDDVKKAFAVMKEERDYVFDETFNVLISAEDL